MRSKRAFGSVEEIEAAYGPPVGYESREDQKKRENAKRQALRRWKAQHPDPSDAERDRKRSLMPSSEREGDRKKHKAEDTPIVDEVHEEEPEHVREVESEMIPAMGDFLAMLGLRLISVPGNGACFYFAIYCTRATLLESDSITIRDLDHVQRATALKQGILGTLLSNLDRMVASGDVHVSILFQRYLGRPLQESTDYGLEKIKAFIRRHQMSSARQGLPHAAWAGEQEIMAAVPYFREPVFVFDVGTHNFPGGRTRDAVFVSMVRLELRSADDPASECVKTRVLDPSEAVLILSTMIGRRVAPLMTTLNHSQAHYECLRLDQQLYSEWAQRDENGHDMRDRLDEALRDLGLYVPPRESLETRAPVLEATARHDLQEHNDQDLPVVDKKPLQLPASYNMNRRGAPSSTQEIMNRYATQDGEDECDKAAENFRALDRGDRQRLWVVP